MSLSPRLAGWVLTTYSLTFPAGVTLPTTSVNSVPE